MSFSVLTPQMAHILFPILLGLSFSPIAQADCLFEVSGSLQVLSVLPLTAGTDLPIAGVTVTLYGSSVWPPVWAAWSQGVTEADGSFVLTSKRSGGACDNGRYLRVAAQFKNEALEIRHEHATTLPYGKVKNYTVFVSQLKKVPGVIDTGKLLFQYNGDYDLGTFEAQQHADIWVLYNKVMTYLDSLGPEFQFQRKVAIKYPHNSCLIPDRSGGKTLERSYANPLNEVVYIAQNSRTDDFNEGTLIHELMHIWAYHHDTGLTGLVSALLGGGTHGLVSDSAVAFHEGWAEFAAEKLLEEIFGWEPFLPYNRPYEIALGLSDLETLSHYDSGITSFLRLLSLREIGFYELGSPADSNYDFKNDTAFVRRLEDTSGLDCRDPSLSLKDIMTVFENIRKEEMNPVDFLVRAAAILPGWDSAVRDAFLALLDPTSTAEPQDFFCTGTRAKTLSTWPSKEDDRTEFRNSCRL